MRFSSPPGALGNCLAHVALLPALSPIKDFGWFIGAPLGGVIYYLMANNRVVVLPTDEKRVEANLSAAQTT